MGIFSPVEVLYGLPKTRHRGQKDSASEAQSYPETPHNTINRHLCAIDAVNSDAYWASSLYATVSSEASDAMTSATIMLRSMSKEAWFCCTTHQVEHFCVKELDLFCLDFELPDYRFGDLPAAEQVHKEPEACQSAGTL